MARKNDFSGIYKITCLINNKVYIGSSNGVLGRRDTHFSLLKRNKHGNKHMQSAYNKHGAISFIHEIVEKCPVKLLLDIEEIWILYYQSHDRRFGFNKTCDTRCPTRGIKQSEERIERRAKAVRKKFVFINPQGEKIEINNLKKFCIENNYPYNSFIAVSNGRRISCAGGWRKNEEKNLNIKFEADLYHNRSNEYSLIDPSGNIYIGKNLSKLCNGDKIKAQSLGQIMNGIFACRYGWKKYDNSTEFNQNIDNKDKAEKKFIKKSLIKHWKFINPNGDVVEFDNLSEFCKKNALYKEGLWEVSKGKIFQCRGWRKFSVEQIGIKCTGKKWNGFVASYSLIDPEGNIHVGKNLSKFCNGDNNKRNGLSKITSGQRDSWYGWRKYKRELSLVK